MRVELIGDGTISSANSNSTLFSLIASDASAADDRACRYIEFLSFAGSEHPDEVIGVIAD